MKIGKRDIEYGSGTPYVIAEISSNHDGSLDRALKLVELAAASGADCVKFQHFRADKIVSKKHFNSMEKLAHQAGWKEDVYSAFERLSVPWEWTEKLAARANKLTMDFMSTPYDLEAVDHLNPCVPAFKIGSGDLTYHDMLVKVAQTGKPVLLGTGASNDVEVHYAVETLRAAGARDICVMQCNTNYTGNDQNYDELALGVLQDYRDQFGGVVGFSDHTTAIAPVVLAVGYGAWIFERHFTDDRSRPGPDHAFSMDPEGFSTMVTELDVAARCIRAGRAGIKRVRENEAETVILQRRAWHAAADLQAGQMLKAEDITALRPATPESLTACIKAEGLILKHAVAAGDVINADAVFRIP
jgi:sialic acid synthase SpsE